MCEITEVGYFIHNLSCMSEAGIKFFAFASHSARLAPPLTSNLKEDYVPNVFTCLSSSYKCGLGEVFEAILNTSLKSTHATTLGDWFLVGTAQHTIISRKMFWM